MVDLVHRPLINVRARGRTLVVVRGARVEEDATLAVRATPNVQAAAAQRATREAGQQVLRVAIAMPTTLTAGLRRASRRHRQDVLTVANLRDHPHKDCAAPGRHSIDGGDVRLLARRGGVL
jgi:hypothetical protein